MTETIHVRAGVPTDQATIVQYQIDMAWETEAYKLDRETVEKGAAAVFEDPRKGGYFIAEREGEVVGCLLTVPEWSEWRNGTVLWIHSVYVIPEARRQGVFQTMYKMLKLRVEADDTLKGLRLYVEKANKRAQQVYDAMGMTDEHYTLYEWLK